MGSGGGGGGGGGGGAGSGGFSSGFGCTMMFVTGGCGGGSGLMTGGGCSVKVTGGGGLGGTGVTTLMLGCGWACSTTSPGESFDAVPVKLDSSTEEGCETAVGAGSFTCLPSNHACGSAAAPVGTECGSSNGVGISTGTKPNARARPAAGCGSAAAGSCIIGRAACASLLAAGCCPDDVDELLLAPVVPVSVLLLLPPWLPK
mmetsp:Transcript_15745/g.36974  ORF Transcript_15745/g.36974 Transcript_15745/m.36974 type:complete len:202 (+) Transcript_15745:478-1083(+)